MRLQAPHLTHRLSLPGYLAEHPSKVFLQSLPILELNPHSIQQLSKNKRRCSDKGVLPLSSLDYLQLLDLSARMQRSDKSGFTP
ncbi:MAG: hypothetical protein ACK5OC_23560, partial [Pirellula sp.]